MASHLSWYPEQETLEPPLFVSSPSLILHIKSMAKGVSLNFNYVQINIQPKYIYFLNPSHHDPSYLDHSKSLCDGHLRFPSQWLTAPANALWNPSVFTLRPCFPRQKTKGNAHSWETEDFYTGWLWLMGSPSALPNIHRRALQFQTLHLTFLPSFCPWPGSDLPCILNALLVLTPLSFSFHRCFLKKSPTYLIPSWLLRVQFIL